MTLRGKEGTWNWKKKHWILLCVKLALEETRDRSYDRLPNELKNSGKYLGTNFRGRIAYFYWPSCSHLFNTIDDRGRLCIWCCIVLCLFAIMIKQFFSCELCFEEFLGGIANYLCYDVTALPVWVRYLVVSHKYSIVVRITRNWELGRFHPFL